jgi:hypothetical protein
MSLALLSIAAIGASLDQWSRPPPATSRLRGGADAPSGAALSRESIMEKLNVVPTFCILDSSGNMVPMEDGDGSSACCFYTDAAEVHEALEDTRAAHPEAALHLGVVPLGTAFSLCAGWAPGAESDSSAPPVESRFLGTLKIQGTRALVEGMSPQLLSQQRAHGLEQADAAAWALPVFCCDELQSPQIMPMFFSQPELADTWLQTGRSAESLPQSVAVLDLRVLVAQMQTDAFRWSLVQFIVGDAALALAQRAKQEHDARRQ